MLPKNWRSWVYVGSPVTPDGLNDSKEGFPEHHNVYIEPGSYEIFKKTGEFPDGTIMFKELQRVLKPAQFPTVHAGNLRAGVTSPGQRRRRDVIQTADKQQIYIASVSLMMYVAMRASA